MRPITIACLVALILAAGLRAQNPPELIYDNDDVRVLRLTMQPNESTPMRDYSTNRLLVCLDNGEGKRTLPDGKIQQLYCKAGEVGWAPAGESYASETTSHTPFQIIEVELKGKEQPPVSITDLDPIIADPKHYQVALENDSVRVVRVRYGPLEQGMVHEHVRNFVVVYLTKQANGERSDVRLHMGEGTIHHTESNPLNEPVERLAIELK